MDRWWSGRRARCSCSRLVLMLLERRPPAALSPSWLRFAFDLEPICSIPLLSLCSLSAAAPPHRATFPPPSLSLPPSQRLGHVDAIKSRRVGEAAVAGRLEVLWGRVRWGEAFYVDGIARETTGSMSKLQGKQRADMRT